MKHGRYEPHELYFDAAIDPEAEGENAFVTVFILAKEDENDSFDEVEGLPEYLTNQMENEWGADWNPEKTVDQVHTDMINAGFEYKKLITWFA